MSTMELEHSSETIREMEQKFDENARDSERTEHTAVYNDFIVEEKVGRVMLYFDVLDRDTVLRRSIYTVGFNVNRDIPTLLEHLRRKTGVTQEASLSQMLGAKISVTEEKGGWYCSNCNSELEEIPDDKVPQWDDKERFEMDRVFEENSVTEKAEHLHSRSEPTQLGKARVCNYYIRDSASNIEQDLEIGLKFVLPDGSTARYECIHDDDHPDETLEKILDYAGNPENIYELCSSKKQIPVVKLDGVWHMYLSKSMFSQKMINFCLRLGVSTVSSRYVEDFGRSYGIGIERETEVGF